MNKNNNSSKVIEKSIRNSFKTALEVFGPLRNWCLKYVRPQSTEDPVREAIEDLIEDSENDATPLEAEERNLLSNILRLKDRAVSDVWFLGQTSQL